MRRIPPLLTYIALLIVALAACDGNAPATPTPVAPGGVRASGSTSPSTNPLRPPASPTLAPATATLLPHLTALPPTPLAPTTPLPNLSALTLQPNEVPTGLRLDPSRTGAQSNVTLAHGDAARQHDFAQWGRQDGYAAVYRAVNPQPNGNITLLSSTVSRYASTEGAKLAATDAVARLQAAADTPLQLLPNAPRYADQSAVLSYRDPSTEVSTCVAVIVRGNLVETITIVGVGVDENDLYPLAARITVRLVAMAKLGKERTTCMADKSKFKFIYLPAAAEMLGVQRSVVLDWVQQGRLRVFSGEGQQVVFRTSEVEKLAEELGLAHPAAAPEVLGDNPPAEGAAKKPRRPRDAVQKVNLRVASLKKWLEVSDEEIREWALAQPPLSHKAIRRQLASISEKLQYLQSLLDKT